MPVKHGFNSFPYQATSKSNNFGDSSHSRNQISHTVDTALLNSPDFGQSSSILRDARKGGTAVGNSADSEGMNLGD